MFESVEDGVDAQTDTGSSLILQAHREPSGQTS